MKAMRQIRYTLARTTVTLGLVALMSGCAAIKDWTTDDNAEPPAPLPNFTPTATLHTVWQASVGNGAGGEFLEMAPLITDTRVFASAADGSVSAFARNSGAQQWSVDVGTTLGSGPGGNDQIIVVGGSEGEVIALNGGSGTELWRANVNSEILSAPGLAENVVAVRTADGHVYGLDSSNGEQLWAYQQAEPVLTLRGTSAPQVFSNGMIVGMDNGSLVTLLSATGQKVWETSVADSRGRSELERIVDIDGDPVILGETVYAVSYQGNVASVSLRDGETLWRREMSSAAGLGVDRNNVYVTDIDSEVWALSNVGGASVWKQEALRARSLTAPAVAGDGVVVGDFEGYLHLLAVDDGRFLARTQVGSGAILAAPVVRDGVIYVNDSKGQLKAITAGSGGG